MKLTQRLKLDDMVQGLYDIGDDDIYNGDATAGWLDMSLFRNVAFVVHVGPTWNAAAMLDSLHISEAEDAVGTGAQAIADLDLDQAAANVAGQCFCLEVQPHHLSDDCRFVRLECAVTDANVNEVNVSVVRSGARYKDGDLNTFTDSV